MRRVFELAGFRVLHQDWHPSLSFSARNFVERFLENKNKARAEAKQEEDVAFRQYVEWALTERIDVALEWQHGPFDFTIRDLLHNCGCKAPIYLCLNYTSPVHDLYLEFGYAGVLDVPFEITDIQVIFNRFHHA